MNNFRFFKIYLYDKLNVPMLPLSMFLNNIAVLWIKMIREISFYFELHKVTLKTEKFSQIFFPYGPMEEKIPREKLKS